MKIKLPFEIDLSTIAQASGGYLLGEDIRISFISTDTRKDVSDSIFIPIRGENFDGHEFIPVASEKGAVAFFSSEDFWEKKLKNDSHFKPFILVKDTSEAFLKLAYYVRSKLKAFVIAVGGSVGKTTTKELIHFIFSELGFKAHKSAKSFNNNVGLAITILSMDKDSELGIFEIGTSHKGEIKYLTKFADPDLGVITAIGKEHLEGLEDEHGVFEEEVDLIRYVVDKQGISVLNIGYRELKRFFDSIDGKKIGFYMMRDSEGFLCKNSIACKVESVDEFFNSVFRLSIDGLGSFVLATNLPPHLGEVVAGSISSVIAYLKYERQAESFNDIFRIDFKKFKREKGRFEVKKRGKIFIIDDTYNSNPTSVEGMFFSASFQKGRKIFVIGDMLELGKMSEQEHENLGNLASKYFDRDEVFFLVNGDFADCMFRGFQRNGFSAYLAKNRNDVVDELFKIVEDGDYVFFKASRRCKFEDILTEFSERIRIF